MYKISRISQSFSYFDFIALTGSFSKSKKSLLLIVKKKIPDVALENDSSLIDQNVPVQWLVICTLF